MKIDVDGRILVKSSTFTLNPEGVAIFHFDEGPKITLKFKIDKSVSGGEKSSISNSIDGDNQGMTVTCYNFKSHSPLLEGVFDEPVQIFAHNGKNYYFTFFTSLLNSHRRVLDVSFFKEK